MEDKEKIALLEEIVRLQKEIIALKASQTVYVPQYPPLPYVAPPAQPFWQWPTITCGDPT